MKIKVIIKRTTIAFGEADVEAVDCDHAEQIVTNDPDLFISEWELASKEYEVEECKDLLENIIRRRELS